MAKKQESELAAASRAFDEGRRKRGQCPDCEIFRDKRRQDSRDRLSPIPKGTR